MVTARMHSKKKKESRGTHARPQTFLVPDAETRYFRFERGYQC